MMPKKLGFTLLEVLIALFIFTIVSFIMSNALHSVLSTHSSTEKSAERLAQLQLVLLLFSRDLEQIINRPISTTDGSLEGALIGTKESITFTHAGFANPQGEEQTSTLQRTRYRVSNGQWIRDTWPQLDQAPHVLPHSRLLLTNIKQLYFRYLDKDNSFHHLWPPEEKQDNKNLPRAVEIDVTFNQGGNLKQIYILPQQQVSTHEPL